MFYWVVSIFIEVRECNFIMFIADSMWHVKMGTYLRFLVLIIHEVNLVKIVLKLELWVWMLPTRNGARNCVYGKFALSFFITFERRLASTTREWESPFCNNAVRTRNPFIAYNMALFHPNNLSFIVFWRIVIIGICGIYLNYKDIFKMFISFTVRHNHTYQQ